VTAGFLPAPGKKLSTAETPRSPRKKGFALLGDLGG